MTPYKIILYITLVISFLYAWSNIKHKKAEIANNEEIIAELLKELDKCR